MTTKMLMLDLPAAKAASQAMNPNITYDQVWRQLCSRLRMIEWRLGTNEHPRSPNDMYDFSVNNVLVAQFEIKP